MPIASRRQPYPAAAVYQRRPWPAPWRQPRPTKPLVIVHVAVILSVAAVMVSTLIMTGDLSFLIPGKFSQVTCRSIISMIYVGSGIILLLL